MDADAYVYSDLFSFLISKEESNQNDIKDDVKETIKDGEYYEEENDLNFDEVIIYSHRNAPGGR